MFTGVAVDGHRDLFIADSLNNRIRRVDAITADIATIAGGSIDDGGAATSAQTLSPSGVAVDGLGNLYISDASDNQIRRVDAITGVITTVAGTGAAGAGSGNGSATATPLDGPTDVAVDGVGNLYIADRDNDVVRYLDMATGVISTVAGTGSAGSGGDDGPATSAGLDYPTGVAVDGAGDLFIADSYNASIRRVDAITGIITTVAGDGSPGSAGDGGSATLAQLDDPTSVAVDTEGNLFIATAAWMEDGPSGVALDSAGNLYIADAYVRRVDRNGVIATVAGTVDPQGMGPLARARLADPRALVVAAPFTLIAGGDSGTVQAVPAGSASVGVVAGRYPQPIPTGALARFGASSFGEVSGVAYDAAAGLIYVTESTANRVDVVSPGSDPTDVDTWTIEPLAGSAAGLPATAAPRRTRCSAIRPGSTSTPARTSSMSPTPAIRSSARSTSRAASPPRPSPPWRGRPKRAASSATVARRRPRRCTSPGR